MDNTRARLLTLVTDPRLASELPTDEARKLAGDAAALIIGLGATLGILLPRALGQNVGGTTRPALVAPHRVSVQEAAERLGISASYIYKNEKSLPFCRRIGRRLVCDLSELDRWDDRRRTTRGNAA